MKLEKYKNFSFEDYAESYEENIIKNVKNLKKKKQCTQSDVANAVNLDESKLSKMLKENGKAQRIPVDTLFYLAEYFNVSVYDLVSTPQDDADLSKRDKEEKEELADKIELFISSRTNIKALQRKKIARNIVEIFESICDG